MTSARVIPLFPLSSLLVPGLVMPLHIFEPRYRQLIADIVDAPEDERGFGVIAIREGQEVGADGARALYDVGTFASLREVEMHEDGRSDIVTVGTERFRVLRLIDGRPYTQAEVEILEEESGPAAPSLGQVVLDRFRAYRALLSDDDDDSDLPEDPRVLSYLVAAAVVADLPTRQGFLEAADDSMRLRTEADFLRAETAIVESVPSLPATDLAREPYGLN
ncbi:MAG: LON peptidase substrate-binding domain-containing protein [Candidatus Nanopelagicales bacterium]